MRDMMKTFGLSGLVMLTLATGLRADQSNNLNYATCKTVLDNALAKIDAEVQQQKDIALADYGRKLKTLKESLRARGDIDAYDVVDAETKRLETSKTLPDKPDPLLTGPVSICQRRLSEVESELSRRKISLFRKYVAALSRLVDSLMSENKLDEAREVNNEMKIIKAILLQMEKPCRADGKQPQSTNTVPNTISAIGDVSSAQLGSTNASNVISESTIYLCEIKEKSTSMGCGPLQKGKLVNLPVNDSLVEHGLFAHAPSKVVYDISALGMPILAGEVGMSEPRAVSVQFKIYGDEKLLWKSPEIKLDRSTNRSMTSKFRVDIKGVRILKLVVSLPRGDDASWARSIWIDPVLTR